jgi:hypothetical protein
MRSTVAQSVGVDISKDTLDVAIHPGGASFRITNNPEGHRALIKRLVLAHLLAQPRSNPLPLSLAERLADAILAIGRNPPDQTEGQQAEDQMRGVVLALSTFSRDRTWAAVPPVQASRYGAEARPRHLCEEVHFPPPLHAGLSRRRSGFKSRLSLAIISMT